MPNLTAPDQCRVSIFLEEVLKIHKIQKCLLSLRSAVMISIQLLVIAIENADDANDIGTLVRLAPLVNTVFAANAVRDIVDCMHTPTNCRLLYQQPSSEISTSLGKLGAVSLVPAFCLSSRSESWSLYYWMTRRPLNIILACHAQTSLSICQIALVLAV